MDEDSRSGETLSLAAQERIDKVCLAFEDAWKSGSCPPLEQYLEGVAESDRSALLRELLRVELHYRSGRGETPSPDEYLARFPHYPEAVAEASKAARAASGTTGSGRLPSRGAGSASGAAEGVAHAVGARIGRYVIRQQLGRGGFGTVYLAWDEQLQRAVAIKTPRPDRFKSSAEEERFFVEVRTAAQLKHPSIVPVHDVGRHDDGRPFVVMDYVEGQSLEQVLKSGRLSHRQLARVMIQVAEAVQYAHKRGFVHRDLKPANVLLDAEGKPLITDFGLAEQWEHVEEPLRFGRARVAGTWHFIPPEIYTGTGGVGPETDVYALGVTLYKALTGRYPFEGADPAEVEEKVLRGDMPLPKEVRPEVPEPLQRICLKAMESDPRHRYESAQMVSDDLRRFLEGREVLARPTRYDAELYGKLKNHCTEIRAWREERLISTMEMDRLMRPYWFMMEADSPWHPLAQRFPWETVLVRLGAWLVLLSSILWPAWYWPDLRSHGERILSVGLPALVMNLAGWMFLRSKSMWNAKIFLGIGALLLPLFVAVVLSEYGWFGQRQAKELELWPPDAPSQKAQRLKAQSEKTPSPKAPSRTYITLTNRQLTATIAVFVAYCLLLVRQCGGRMLVIWLGAGIYALFTAVLLLCGLKQWWNSDQLAWTTVYYLGLCVLFCPAALWWKARGSNHGAAWLFIFFPVPFALSMTALGWYGSEQWRLAKEALMENHTKNLWWTANGAAYALAGLLSLRAPAGFIRYWGTFFLLLVPLSLLVPTNLMFDKGTTLLPLGDAPFTIYELLGILFAAGLIVAGTKTSQPTLALPGLIGLTVVVGRITHDHFRSYLEWPLALALGGGLAILIGAASSLIRARLQYRTRP